MSHSVAANFLLPTILHTLKPAAVVTKPVSTAGKPASGAAAATSSATGATGGLDTTFLNLLVKELQNQDPTAPMDSTAMVGQMISLNQLDQLISINQEVETGSALTSSATGSAAAKAVTTPSVVPGSSPFSNTMAPGNTPSVFSPSALSSGALQMQNFLGLGKGGATAPVEPIFGGPNGSAGPIMMNDSTFGSTLSNDNLGGK